MRSWPLPRLGRQLDFGAWLAGMEFGPIGTRPAALAHRIRTVFADAGINLDFVEQRRLAMTAAWIVGHLRLHLVAVDRRGAVAGDSKLFGEIAAGRIAVPHRNPHVIGECQEGLARLAREECEG